MANNNGGPAFPVKREKYDHTAVSDAMHGGMTLRDYFAAEVCAAMVSTIRSDDDYNRAAALAKKMGFDGLSEWFSADAYKQADAMLRARESSNGQ